MGQEEVVWARRRAEAVREKRNEWERSGAGRRPQWGVAADRLGRLEGRREEAGLGADPAAGIPELHLGP